jgi:hypothetical protein
MGLTLSELEGAPLVQILAGSAWEGGRFAAGLHSLADHLKRRECFSNLVLPVEVAGKTRGWELSASPRHDDNGAFLGFRGVASDVTLQRESADKIAICSALFATDRPERVICSMAAAFESTTAAFFSAVAATSSTEAAISVMVVAALAMEFSNSFA